MFEIFTTVTYSSGWEYVSIDGKTLYEPIAKRLGVETAEPSSSLEDDRGQYEETRCDPYDSDDH